MKVGKSDLGVQWSGFLSALRLYFWWWGNSVFIDKCIFLFEDISHWVTMYGFHISKFWGFYAEKFYRNEYYLFIAS